jgi:predicted RNA binding protein YcfA (HicA-like mRNA interferase family)
VRYRDAARKLVELGCYEIPRRGGGSHRRWFNPETQRDAVLPDWGSRDLKIGTLRSAARQLGLDGVSAALTQPPCVLSGIPAPLLGMPGPHVLFVVTVETAQGAPALDDVYNVAVPRLLTGQWGHLSGCSFAPAF